MDTNDASALVLQALVWTLQDERRARRLLDLTGLEANTLRAHIHEASTQRAVVEFLEGNEADLIACAEALEVSPMQLLSAKAALK
jgi:hypothetical protein